MSNHKFNPDALYAELNKSFTQFEELFDRTLLVHKITEAGGKKPAHQIWWGDPGYAKSTLAELILFHLTGKQPSIQALTPTTLPEHILGGYDMKMLMAEGEVRVMLENSVFCSEGAILEEAFDAPTFTLTVLKDMLLRGAMCTGGKCVKIETKYCIIATNVDPMAWVESSDPKDLQSSIGILNRFPWVTKVEWKDHSVRAYLDALNKQHPDPKLRNQREEVAELAGMAAQMGEVMNPRMVIGDLFPGYCVDPLSTLKALGGLGPKVRQELISRQKNVSEYAKVRGLATKANQLKSIQLDKVKREDLPSVAATVNKLINELENLGITYGSPDGLYTAYEEALKITRKVHEDIIKRITNPGKLLVNDIEGLLKLYGKQ